jgi:hypothetical protein
MLWLQACLPALAVLSRLATSIAARTPDQEVHQTLEEVNLTGHGRVLCLLTMGANLYI